MRKFIFFMVSAFVLGTSSAHAIFEKQNSCMKNIDSFLGGGSDPWPWGSEIRFPWARIQGVWAPNSTDCGSYFVFEKGVESVGGKKIVRITQYDPNSCEKISSGVGFENGRVIVALMTNGRQSFELSIRAFDSSIIDTAKRSSDAPANFIEAPGSATAITKPVIVVSLYPRQKFEKNSSYRLEKIQSIPSLICHDF